MLLLSKITASVQILGNVIFVYLSIVNMSPIRSFQCQGTDDIEYNKTIAICNVQRILLYQ